LQKGRMLSAQAASAQMVDDMIQFVRTACQARLFVQKTARMTVKVTAFQQQSHAKEHCA